MEKITSCFMRILFGLMLVLFAVQMDYAATEITGTVTQKLDDSVSFFSLARPIQEISSTRRLPRNGTIAQPSRVTP